MRSQLRLSAHELGRIDRTRALAQLEVKLRLVHLTGAPSLGDDLAATDLIAALDQDLLVMRIRRHPVVRMPDQHEIAVAFQLVAGIGDVPFSAAFTGVPAGTATLMPSLCPPSGLVPNSEMIRPRAGQRKCCRMRRGRWPGCWLIATWRFLPADAGWGGREQCDLRAEAGSSGHLGVVLTTGTAGALI